MGERMKTYLDLDITMLNDVRAITYGAWAFGASRGVDSMACFAIGTGGGAGGQQSACAGLWRNGRRIGASDRGYERADLRLREPVFLMPVEKINILPAKLGTDAGIVGMAAWSVGKPGEIINA